MERCCAGAEVYVIEICIEAWLFCIFGDYTHGFRATPQVTKVSKGGRGYMPNLNSVA